MRRMWVWLLLVPLAGCDVDRSNPLAPVLETICDALLTTLGNFVQIISLNVII